MRGPRLQAASVLLATTLVAAVAAQTAAPSAAANAGHTPYGAGCYDVARESFAVLFADAATAAPTLTGQSLLLAPVAGGYHATWGGVPYLAPTSAAASLPPSDDGQVVIALPQAMPVTGGTTATLWVHSNGIVACGPGIDGGSWNTPPNDFTPSRGYRHAPDTAFFAWHDWNPAEPGSGRIKTEQRLVADEPVLCVTWHDVENFPTGLVNRGTFQFQFGLATGRVGYVWVQVDASTGSPFSTAHLVGYSPGGPSLDREPVLVGAAFSTAPDVRALALSANLPPVSTSTNGTVVPYTTHHAPTVLATTDVRLGLVALSLGAAPGIDLGMVGAPGCKAHVQSLDLTFLLFGTTAEPAVAITYPPGLPAGLDVFLQSLVLVTPQVWNDEVNTLGLVTSNGIRSHIAPH